LYKTKAVLVSGLEGRIGAQPGVLIAAAGAPAPAMIAFLMKRLLLRGRRATGRWEKERWGGARRSER
jgi:glutamate synthase domain-containing protein 2